jgi:type IV secretory pathway component VirB8
MTGYLLHTTDAIKHVTIYLIKQTTSPQSRVNFKNTHTHTHTHTCQTARDYILADSEIHTCNENI